MAELDIIFRAVTCNKCGVTFIPTVEWAYKDTYRGKKAYYCTWKCFNHRYGEEGRVDGRRKNGGKKILLAET